MILEKKEKKVITTIYIILCMLFTFNLTYGQEILSISGKVISGDDNSPMVGVTVFVKNNPAKSASTDINGGFSISGVTATDVLSFSFVGYETKEESVGTRTTIDVVLNPSAQQLKETVVTALGISRSEKAVGYATTKVTNFEVEKASEYNLSNSLNSKVAGVQVTQSSGTPGAAVNIRIRGNSSATQSNQPLIVVDGMPISNDFNSNDNTNNNTGGVVTSNRLIDIDPNDIQDIQVLKGGASVALYGLRATNGVLLITTKSAKYGGELSRPQITYTGNFSLDEVNKLPELQKKYAQGLNGVYRDASNPTSASWGPLLLDLRYDGNDNYLWDKRGKLVLSTDPTATANVPTAYDPASFFQNGLSQNHHIGIGGGGKTFAYNLSFGYLDQGGIIPLSNFKRYNVRLNTDIVLSNKIKNKTSLQYSNSGGRRPQSGSNVSGIMLALVRTPISFDNRNGLSSEDAVNNKSSYVTAEGGQRSYTGGAIYDNPYWIINNIVFRDNTDRFIGNTEFNVDIVKGLSLLYRFGLDNYTETQKDFYEIGSRNNPNGSFSEAKITNTELYSLALLTYKNSIEKVKVNYSVSIGHNYEDYDYKLIRTLGTGLAKTNFQSFDNASAISVRDFDAFPKKKNAFLANINADYKDMLFLDINLRPEWSSTLPKDNNVFLTHSYSLSFVFSELIKSNNIFNFGKLRGQFAVIGKDAPTQTNTTYLFNGLISDGWLNESEYIKFPYQGVGGYTYGGTSKGNEKLKAETTTNFEVGLELGFFNSRLRLNYSYYNALSENQVIKVNLPPSTGFSSIYDNAGSILNEGHEIEIHGTPIKELRGFNWDASLNMTQYNTIVKELGAENIGLTGFTSTGSYLVKGQQYGVIRGGTFKRDPATNKLLIGTDGFPLASGTNGNIGNPIPDFLMGLRNTISWKGIQLSFLWDFRFGGDIWNGTKGALTTIGTSKITEDRGKTVVFDGINADASGKSLNTVNTKVVALDQNWYRGNGGGFGAVAEHFIERVNWARLRDLSLSYTFDKKLLSKTKILKGASITFSTRNLALITNYTGIDPETNLTGATNGIGLDYFNNPNTRSFVLNLKLTF